MRLSRDAWLALGLLVVLFAVTSVAALYRPDDVQPPALSSLSTGPEGARALRLWLDELGYGVSDASGAAFAIADQADLALLLEPSEPLTTDDLQRLDEWVEAGGTALIVGQGPMSRLAFNHYGVNTEAVTSTESVAAWPLLASPPLLTPAPSGQTVALVSANPDILPLAGAGAQTTALLVQRGDGHVILASFPQAFSNQGLKEPGNAELVLSLISLADGESVWFDEWHHGQRPGAPGGSATLIGPEAWLRATPAGHALVFAAALLFLVIALRGQRFGRPVPLARELVRRSPLEFVNALANLSRRAGHRAAVVAHYHQRLKRHLGRRYRLDPTLRDAEFVARLTLYNPSLDREGLTRLLASLRATTIREPELIRLAAEVAEWTQE